MFSIYRHFNTIQTFESRIHPTTSFSSSGSLSSPPPGPPNHVLLLDCWERMVNVQYTLRRFSHLSLDANFTLVEPFVYNSKVSLSKSAPYSFQKNNLSQQPASTYFRTSDLENTGRYISYSQFLQCALRTDQPSYFIHAVLFFTWADQALISSRRNESESNQLPKPFFWCNSNLRLLPGSLDSSTGLHNLTPTLQISRAICASPSSLTNSKFFQILFQIVRERMEAPPLSCSASVSVALPNYRKHLLSSYTTMFGDQPAKHRVPPLGLSVASIRVASQLIDQTLGSQPFLAVHLRAGKAYTLLKTNGVSSFELWLTRCTRRLINAAGATNLPVYIASDLFNRGWLGGETATKEFEPILRAARIQLQTLSRGIIFDPHRLGIWQDEMGMASVVDAAVAVKAHKFLYGAPSSFGRWVQELRLTRGASSENVLCPITA